MTSRFDSLAQLRRDITLSADLFGHFRNTADQPAIELGSRHHLSKQVNGVALKRPPWYFDTKVQGDGLSDIQAHMIDQAQWLIAADADWQAENQQIDSAKRWTTPVPQQLFSSIAGSDDFPEPLANAVNNSELAYACNGTMEFRLRDISICTRAEWGAVEPPNGGDLHQTTVRGSVSNIELEHGPETDFVGYLHLRPHSGDVKLATKILHAEHAQRQKRFPGLRYEPYERAIRFVLPAELRTTHERHFTMALNEFLDYLQQGESPRRIVASNSRTLYADSASP